MPRNRKPPQQSDRVNAVLRNIAAKYTAMAAYQPTMIDSGHELEYHAPSKERPKQSDGALAAWMLRRNNIG